MILNNFRTILRNNLVVFTLSLLTSAAALAKSNCKAIEGVNDVLNCVIKNHSIIKGSLSQAKEASMAVDLADQSINPSFEFEAVNSDNNALTTELSLLHTIELGGKKAARVLVAKRQRDIADAIVIGLKEKLIVATVVQLYRLRQINHEMELLSEIISTFRKISKQYARASRLNPEDGMSLTVFSLALEENQLRATALSNEEQQILSQLEIGLGQRLVLTADLLPEIKRNWPSLVKGSLIGAASLSAKAKLDYDSARYNLAKSEAWPNLAVGPKVVNDDSADNKAYFGVALSLNLPLYQTNQAGVATSAEAMQRSQFQIHSTRLRSERQRNYLVRVYNDVAKAIQRALSNQQINLRHKDLHNMINRGVISAPIVIELHRQISDYYITLHQQEIEGVRAYWQIAALEGRISSEELR